jgi:4-hydroxyphenylpyruvate dioxygenase
MMIKLPVRQPTLRFIDNDSSAPHVNRTMPGFEELKITGFDHLEFAVADLEKSAELYLQLGFEKLATRHIRERQLQSYLMGQNDVFVLLSHSTEAKDPIAQYVRKHGDGIATIAFRCEDAATALDTALRRGASVTQPPKALQRDFGSVTQAAIAGFGDVQLQFLSRDGLLFAEGFDTPYSIDVRGNGLTKIDHLTVNVEAGQRGHWKEFFEKVFGLVDSRFFDIQTDKTGLYSTVMESPNHAIRIPINEPTGEKSQIQEFLDIHHGPGVQHAALSTESILTTLAALKSHGIAFLDVPDSYYEMLPKRIHYFTESLEELKKNRVLVDGNGSGYLLQIFSKNLVGPFFFEIIQRKADMGFGEGNFRALFEAIEREQQKRSYL